MQQTNQTATITGLSHEGRGIAHIDGKTVFIRGALPGEEVTFKYTKRRSQFTEADCVEVIKSAPERVQPPCPHFNICGGCSLQHLNHKEQIAFKQNILLEHFKHIAKIDIQKNQLMPPIVADTLAYRRKARLSVKYVKAKERVLVGFHEIKGRFVADIESCAILDEVVGTKLIDLSELIASLSIFNKVPQIEVACGDNCCGLILRCLEPPTDEDQLLLRNFAIKHNLLIYIQPKGLDSIYLLPQLQETAIVASHNLQLHYNIAAENLQMNFAPYDFVQINAAINQKMLAQALKLLQLNSNDIVLDLFCGLGNFSLPIAKHSKQVVAIEGDAGLVERAKINAEHNNIRNVEFFAADLNQDWTEASWMQHKFSKIVLDPPRTGALNIIQQLVKLKVPQILYVSCNPATLARDAKELLDNGYKLQKIGIMDMFPHTKHVETMALFVG